MSNPAIVLMTDPSRCSLGDVHYLLQALLEMQQMGGHAVPQAFCDHPAAAKGFIEAYTHAYPQLVLQDGAIPTPDYLQSLIANGQVGALAQTPELAAIVGQGAVAGQAVLGVPSRPAEQGGSSGFPIMVLTLGSSQVLIDAMQQSPAMKDSIRLIDIAPEGADSLPVSVAEAVAIGGLDSDGAWESEGLGHQRLELDEVAGASAADSGRLAFDDDSMDLDVVETAVASSSHVPRYDDGGEQQPAAPEPSGTADQTEPAVAAEPAVEIAPPDEGYEASPSAEPVPEVASAVETVRPSDAELADLDDSADDLASQEEGGHDESGEEGGEPKDPAGEDTAGEDADDANEVAATLASGVLDDDDVDYPPVGSLIAGSDVLYPALDQAAAQSVLQELVSVMLDDAIFDPDQAFEGSPSLPDDLSPDRLRVDEVMIRSSEQVVTIEDLYGSFDEDGEDVFADSGVPPSHDTDL